MMIILKKLTTVNFEAQNVSSFLATPQPFSASQGCPQ